MITEAELLPVDFVKKVGKGRTLSADLTGPEARTAFTQLLEGAFHPAQAGAFLQALRIKELTQDELNALADVFRSRLAEPPTLSGADASDPAASGPGDKTLVLNLASDTQRKGGLASLLAAHLLRRFGVGVGIIRSEPVLQKNRASFDGTWELAELLDLSGPLFPAASAGPGSTALAAAPVLADCGALVRGLAALDDLRSHLGFRSCLHTAEKLVNPWPASPILLGISHKHYALRMAATLAAQGMRGRILLGNHGTVDLVLHKETEIVIVGADGSITEASVSPAALGLDIPSDIYSLGKFPQWREWLLAMGPDAGAAAAGAAGAGAVDARVAGSAPEARGNGLRKAIQYHLAVLLWAAGIADDAAAGLAAAKRAIPTLFDQEA